MLKGIKMEYSSIAKAINSLDIEEFEGDQIESISMFLPDQGEIEELKKFNGNVSELGNAEKYYLSLIEVSQLALKINIMKYKKNFPETYEDLKHRERLIRHTVKLLSTDKRFHAILETVLAIGNYINGSTPRGQIYGFKLTSLVQLLEVKSSKNRELSLLHFLVDYLTKNNPELMQFFDDLEDVHSCARENIDDLVTRVNQLTNSFNPIEAAINNEESGPKLKNKLGGWAEEVKSQVSGLQKNMEKLQKDYKELIEYYAEPPTTKSEEFFGNISSFGKSMQKGVQDLIKIKEDEEKEAKRLQREGETKPKKVGGGGGGGTPPGPSQGQLDQILAQMKKGNAFKKVIEE